MVLLLVTSPQPRVVDSNERQRQLARVDEGKRPTPPHIVEYFDVGVQAEPMSDMTSGDLCVDQIGSYSSTAALLGVEDQGVRTTEESLERVIQHLSSKDLAGMSAIMSLMLRLMHAPSLDLRFTGNHNGR
jgi:hypothetical protein